MTVDKRLENIEETQKAVLTVQVELMESVALLVEAIRELEPLGSLAARESLEVQHQRFKAQAES